MIKFYLRTTFPMFNIVKLLPGGQKDSSVLEILDDLA